MGNVFEGRGTIRRNEQVGPGLFLMEVGEASMARAITPGQFVHVGLPGMEGHILRRPFSVYSACGDSGTIDILYQAVGFGTRHMAGLGPGAAVSLLGPLGRAWHPPEDTRCALLVGGGVGAAPLFLLAAELVRCGSAVDVVLGAQTADALVCRGRYEALLAGAPAKSSLRCATDDGSFGHAGFCTPLVEERLAARSYDYAAVCGPEPMMRIVIGQMEGLPLACEASLERRMACGVGACLSCVVATDEGMRRACVDGPVFDARKVVFA
ncbi:MAG: dihydroorotate dehydrogenase electron transfer subunit [Eggerthellaceae bacterium]|nr:dihydroorotate dehydrogenase electron transfer subunit [Eggerthellaceae bacterium]